ncbi:MAG: zinc ribbon domain-containing protein [Gracilibacteraceae bacterium]|jgi:hypothetical protein|nr:zinc ribbon domain-containing protein [Gracilibacteraceae bacterium]
MKAETVFSKTMPFVWAKLLLGLATVVISAILFGILMGLAWLFNSESVTAIMFFAWVGAIGVVRFILMHYIGYMLKAGHIAVITEIVTTGQAPANQIAYGKQQVLARFATSNIYFAVDKLVAAAVKQIQRGIGKLGNALDFIPGMGAISGLAQFFIELALGYIDECCLGYTFYQKEQGAWKSAADGVAIYAQNWKKLLGNAAKTMVLVILGLCGLTLALFVVLGLLFRLFAWPGWAAFVIALLLALTVKYAFIDSYILARTMTAYMEDAPTTVIAFDLYGRLSGISAKFKELWDKGRQEEPMPAPQPQPVLAGAGAGAAGYGAPQPAGAAGDSGERPAFCGQCGAANKRGVKFCGGCGASMP